MIHESKQARNVPTVKWSRFQFECELYRLDAYKINKWGIVIKCAAHDNDHIHIATHYEEIICWLIVRIERALNAVIFIHLMKNP